MNNPRLMPLDELISLFLAWVQYSIWAEEFDMSARLTLRITSGLKPGDIFKFLLTVPNEHFGTVATLIVEDYIGDVSFSRRPLAEFIREFKDELDYKSLDWLDSLPGTQLQLFEIIATDGVWLTAQNVLCPDEKLLFDPKSHEPIRVGDIRLERVLETELSLRRSSAGFRVPAEM